MLTRTIASMIMLAVASSAAYAQSDVIAVAQQGVPAVEIAGLAPERSVVEEVGWMRVRQTDAAGNLVWSGIAFNALANEGESSILDTYFRGAAAPSGLVFGAGTQLSITDIARVMRDDYGNPLIGA